MRSAIVNRDALLAAYSVVAKAAANAKSGEMVLQNVALVADEGAIRLEAQNLRMALMQTIGANTDDSFETLLDSTSFKKIATALAANETRDVTITAEDDGKIRITSGKGQYKMPGGDARAFPFIPSLLGKPEAFTLPCSELAKAIRRMAVTTAKGPGVARGYDKVFLDNERGKLVLVATDTVRLVIQELDVDPGEDFRAILPLDCLVTLGKILPHDGDAVFRFDDNETQCSVELPWGLEAIIRMGEREFPDWRKIVPKGSLHSATIDADELKTAVKALLPLAKRQVTRTAVPKRDTEGKKQEKIISASYKGLFSFRPAGLALSVDDGAGIEAEQMIAAEVEGIEHETLAFNLRFLSDFLAVTDGSKNVKIHFTSCIYPTIWTADGCEGLSYLLMPINL